MPNKTMRIPSRRGTPLRADGRGLATGPLGPRPAGRQVLRRLRSAASAQTTAHGVPASKASACTPTWRCRHAAGISWSGCAGTATKSPVGPGRSSHGSSRTSGVGDGWDSAGGALRRPGPRRARRSRSPGGSSTTSGGRPSGTWSDRRYAIVSDADLREATARPLDTFPITRVGPALTVGRSVCRMTTRGVSSAG